MKFVNYKILFGAILIIFLGIILKNTTQELIKIKNNGSYVERLEKELEYEKNRNSFLTEQLKFVQTDTFIEQESRNRLGLVQSNEIIVQKEIENPVRKTLEEKLSTPNWKQWIELFL